MVHVDKSKLEDSIKNVTLSVLNELIAHNVRGADLLKKALVNLPEIKSEIEKYYDLLKVLLNLLKPVFEIARDWLVKCYNHLVVLFDWAKEKWNEIFGK